MNESNQNQNQIIASSEILLSICILSYNQANEIKRLLVSIQNQYTNEIEILMRDDSTNNETEELIKEYSTKMPVRYYRGTKEGIDKTVIFLTKTAVGKCIWWMGDDTIEPGGVLKVLNVIKSNQKVNFIWANYQLYNTSKLAIDINSNQCKINKNELLKLGGAGLGFISATIFEREMGLKGLEGAEKYIGSLFSNLFIVLSVISKSNACYYIKGPIVICHPTTSEEIKLLVTNKNGEINNRGFEVYGITFPAIIKEFKNDFSPKIIEKVIKTSFRQTWQGMYVGWIGGWDTPNGKKMKLLKNYWKYPSVYLALILFTLPMSINKILLQIHRKIKINT